VPSIQYGLKKLVRPPPHLVLLLEYNTSTRVQLY
jgi:hypothetical protein